MHFTSLLALAGAATAATLKGFNYGSTASDGSAMLQADFEALFERAQDLQGTSGFASARLYTMIQADTTNTYTQAIEAAINTKTTLLLGLWCSGGETFFENELTALSSAIEAYGTSFTDLIEAISVGSEDLYRDSVTGIEADDGVGATPDQIVAYIAKLRATIKGTDASAALVGHVDTWNAWTNSSNAAVIEAVDFLGMDGYPYYQTTDSNGIDNAETLFFESYDATVAVADGKDVWVTETGWPYQGPTENDAVASVANAETYWQDVACRLLGSVNVYWYTLQETTTSTSDVSFGLIGNTLADAPLYDLTCNSTSSSASTAKTTSTKTSTAKTTATEASATSVATTTSNSSSPSSAKYTSAATSASSQASSPSASEYSSGVSSKVVEPSTLTTAVTATPSTSSPVTTLVTVTSSKETGTATTASTSPSCPTDLSGVYQFPHLIVPVNSSAPTKAYGTSYDGTISPDVSTIFNFDIPASYSGKTCALVFLFPKQSELTTSSFTFNGEGGIEVVKLESVATEKTTYDTVPAASGAGTTISSVEPGNSYLISTSECSAGGAVAFEFSSVDGLDLQWFEDYNPSPIGAYITVC